MQRINRCQIDEQRVVDGCARGRKNASHCKGQLIVVSKTDLRHAMTQHDRVAQLVGQLCRNSGTKHNVC